MAEEEMYQKYRQYIGSINAGRWDQMHEFVADQASINGILMTPLQYGETIAAFSRTCENGLRIELLDVVIDAAQGRIAAKLIASGKPIAEFFGMQPTGRLAVFNMAAFYNIENGKIVKASNIVDRADIAESLAGGGIAS